MRRQGINMLPLPKAPPDFLMLKVWMWAVGIFSGGLKDRRKVDSMDQSRLWFPLGRGEKLKLVEDG